MAFQYLEKLPESDQIVEKLDLLLLELAALGNLIKKR
jgi:hypothetical protein